MNEPWKMSALNSATDVNNCLQTIRQWRSTEVQEILFARSMAKLGKASILD